jgi:hypothetical protein
MTILLFKITAMFVHGTTKRDQSTSNDSGLFKPQSFWTAIKAYGIVAV